MSFICKLPDCPDFGGELRLDLSDRFFICCQCSFVDEAWCDFDEDVVKGLEQHGCSAHTEESQ